MREYLTYFIMGVMFGIAISIPITVYIICNSEMPIPVIGILTGMTLNTIFTLVLLIASGDE